MKLTGKAKEKFFEFTIKNYGFDEYVISYLKETLQHALIIDFFDSVGYGISINIEMLNIANSCVDECENCDECYDIWKHKYEYIIYLISDSINKVNDYSTHISDDYFKTRQEATEKAIERANEIYNETLA
tara:strand:- start:2109 stop:2498 length:390 start_codon:yes stop_codon:yes gene_type:complete